MQLPITAFAFRSIHAGDFSPQARRIRMAKQPTVKELTQTVAQLEKELTAYRLKLNRLQVDHKKYKKLYEKTKNSENIYRSIIDSSADAIAIFDLNGKVKYVSPSFTTVFGWSKAEIEGKRIPFLPESEKEKTTAFIINLTLHGTPCYGLETKRYKKDGSLVDVSLSASRFHAPDGKPEGMFVILHDISEIKKLQKLLLQAKKMQALGTLAGGIANEFNNIIVNIIGCTEMIGTDLESDSLSGQNLEEIRRAAYRARDLIRHIRTFSGEPAQDRRSMHVQTVVHEALKLLRTSLPSNIKFEQHISEECGPVLADPAQIHQVIMNLGANAIDAMRKNGGTLQISIAEATIADANSSTPAGLDSGSYLKMSVSDTGHGMDRTIKDRIFDPFFTTKSPGNGTGMGLSVVHGIVKECDGTIDVHSEPDKGTTLTIYLPLIEEHSESTGKAVRSHLNGGDRFTILVVDDDKTLRLMLRQHLQAAGYNVAEAAGGRKALQILASETVNLVLTDIRMPEMDGFELMAHMSADYPFIPTMVMTGYGTPETASSFEEMGSLQVMDKPLDLGDLTHRITESLHQVSQGGTMTGISVASFLQLIQLEQKSCVLEVHGKNGQKGFLYFNQGVLCDAVCGRLKQEEATLEIVSWENVLLSFNALPRKKTQRKIKTDLMSLLLEGLKQKDETRA